MGQFGFTRTTAKTDAVQAFQVRYSSSEGNYALLDVYVPTSGDNALIIHVARPGAGLLASQPTNGRGKTKIAFSGNQSDAAPDDLSGMVEYVSSGSVERYIAPRLALMMARIHGQALTA